MEAMRGMGFPSTRTKAVLKRLLNACENNWEHIEAENYWLLVEAILEADEPEVQFFLFFLVRMSSFISLVWRLSYSSSPKIDLFLVGK